MCYNRGCITYESKIIRNASSFYSDSSESDGEKVKKYEVGDYLVHENSGVCQVKAIQTMALSGKGSEREYYSLVPVFHRDSQVITPVDSDKVRVRDVKSAKEMHEIISQMKDLDVIEEANDKQRAEKYKEHIGLFEPVELARVVKTVYERRLVRMKQGKRIMSQDERVLATAGKKLFEEMAFVFDMDLKTIEDDFYKVLKEDVSQELA